MEVIEGKIIVVLKLIKSRVHLLLVKNQSFTLNVL